MAGSIAPCAGVRPSVLWCLSVSVDVYPVFHGAFLLGVWCPSIVFGGFGVYLLRFVCTDLLCPEVDP